MEKKISIILYSFLSHIKWWYNMEQIRSFFLLYLYINHFRSEHINLGICQCTSWTKDWKDSIYLDGFESESWHFYTAVRNRNGNKHLSKILSWGLVWCKRWQVIAFFQKNMANYSPLNLLGIRKSQFFAVFNLRLTLTPKCDEIVLVNFQFCNLSSLPFHLSWNGNSHLQ